MKARIFDIIRCSLHDGDGIRTVVYLKGCTLQCRWCHNPEGISTKPEILYRKNRCIKCGRCVELCQNHHIISEDAVTYERKGCSLCMKCVAVCPNEALVACGKDVTAEEVFAEIIKDRHFYEASGGGVTISGGECLLYPDFLLELLKMCKESGINTVIETAFNVPWNNLETVRDVIDTFIIDIKHFDDEIHKQLTGSGNQLIISNIERISRLHSSILIRIPCIPGVNDDSENLIGTARLINTFGEGIKAVELLKYNNLGGSKYIALDMEDTLPKENPQDDKVMEVKRLLVQEHIRSGVSVL